MNSKIERIVVLKCVEKCRPVPGPSGTILENGAEYAGTIVSTRVVKMERWGPEVAWKRTLAVDKYRTEVTR